jgi:alkylation response protein AidB-like acyl-CoA dehydrogenase
MNTHDLVGPVAADILAQADRAERERQLPGPLMDRLVEAGLFSIYTPRQFGGLGLELPEALAVVEEVSRLDGSTGWTVALGFSNEFFTSVLEDEYAARIFQHGSALIASAPGFAVQARPVGDGYTVTGQWQFASGAPNAAWAAVAAPLFDGEAPRMGPEGPAMVIAFVPLSQLEIVDTWHVTGLRATGSHDLRANGVFVPAGFAGDFAMPAGPLPRRDSVLARIPFTTILAVAQSPAVCLGIARRAIDEFRELARAKERPPAPRLSDQVQAQAGLARAEALVSSARSYWYETVRELWTTAKAAGDISLDLRTRVRLASLTVAENCAEAVDRLFRLSGTTAIFQSSPIERCWRDVHTAAQHFQVQDGRWETAGRILFGLEPNSPII